MPRRGLAVEPLNTGITHLLSNKHIFDCTCQLNEAGIKGFLKLRQGLPDSQIIKEIDEGDYDLIAVAAESYGEFVQRTWETGDALNKRYPLLVVKPEIPQPFIQERSY